MRVFLVASVVLVMLYVAVAQSISSSPAEQSEVSCVLEVEASAPGVAEAEQFAHTDCSHANFCIHYIYVVEAEIVKEPFTALKNARGACSFTTTNSCNYDNVIRAVALAPTAGTALKLPSVIAVNDEPDAREAACSNPEVGAVGVQF